ncbi:MAG TPA: hypothetical protein PKN37_08025 [Mesotoga sp.]|uniref:hypothetical protein n=1 Tax=Mesotoga sp. TaxID=2053577 RepID=UPI002CE319E3|nr:hypothetical protein [Mesotoga sp.]
MHKYFLILLALIAIATFVNAQYTELANILATDMGIEKESISYVLGNNVIIGGYLSFGGSVDDQKVIGISIREVPQGKESMKQAYLGISDIVASRIVIHDIALNDFYNSGLPAFLKHDYLSCAIISGYSIEVSSIVSKKSYVTDRWVATAYLVEKEQLTATDNGTGMKIVREIIADIDELIPQLELPHRIEMLEFLDSNSEQIVLEANQLIRIIAFKAEAEIDYDLEKARVSLNRLPENPYILLKEESLSRDWFYKVGNMMNKTGCIEKAISYWLCGLFFSSDEIQIKEQILEAIKRVIL